MSPPETANPEARSNNALLCIGIGAGLIVLSWLLGIGGVLATVAAGGDPTVAAGGIGMLIALPLAALSGFLLVIVGGVWMFARVVADQRNEASEKRYRDVQR